jgi:sugar phosphate permease
LVAGAFAALTVGYVIDKIRVRPLILFATIGMGLVTIALSRTNGLPLFYLLFALLGVFGSVVVAYGKIITALFNRHRGKALAIFGAESAVAVAIAPQLINLFTNNFGWRGSFIVEGVIILICAPILYFCVEEPGSLGTRQVDKAKPADLPGKTFAQALKDPVLWMIMLAAVIAAIPRGALAPFLVPILTERGFPGRQTAANVTTVLWLMQAAGSLVMGFCLDKFHTAKIAVPFKLLAMVGLILITITSTAVGGLPMLTIAFAIWGFSTGTLKPAGRYFQARFFGFKSFGAIAGLDDFLTFIFAGVLAPIIGRSADKTGSFDIALWSVAAALLVGALIYLVLGPYRYDLLGGAAAAKSKQAGAPTPQPSTSG